MVLPRCKLSVSPSTKCNALNLSFNQLTWFRFLVGHGQLLARTNMSRPMEVVGYSQLLQFFNSQLTSSWSELSVAILEVDSVFYWIGENKLDGSPFQSINCYSSTVGLNYRSQMGLKKLASKLIDWDKDLVQWTFENELLTRQDSGDLGPDRVVERPKVIYNEETSTYVLWLHIDDSSYGEAKTGVATSSSVCGTYNYL